MLWQTPITSAFHTNAYLDNLSAAAKADQEATASARERYFQLEELEDAESAITEIFLDAYGKVRTGATDGPVFLNSFGTWNQEPSTGGFEMRLSRTYQAGIEQRKFTDMGELNFEVERVYTGPLTTVGALMAVEGSMHCIDDHVGDQQVGFFKMIDSRSGKQSP